MRFLHTSDWHIGKGLKGRSRLDEQERVIAEILDIAQRENIDCLLHSGDVFDSIAPPPEAEKLVYWFFSELAGRRIPSVIIAGNHDHPKRLAAVRPLLDRLTIHVRSEVQRENVVTIGDARIAVLPWVWIHRLTPAEMLLGPQEKMVEKYSDRMTAMIRKLTEGMDGSTVNILVAHLYAYGAELSAGAEKAATTTQPYSVPPHSIPGHLSYVALGHLHRPQEVNAPSPMYYAGSPLQLDFGEQQQLKRVFLIDAKPGIKARVDSVVLTAGRQLRDVSGSFEELRRNSEEFGSDYLRVTVELDKPRMGVADEIREFLPMALDIRSVFPQREQPAPVAAETVRATPGELFRQFAAGEPEPVLAVFDELYEEASRAAR